MGLARNRLVQAGTFLIGLLVMLAVAAPLLPATRDGLAAAPKFDPEKRRSLVKRPAMRLTVGFSLDPTFGFTLVASRWFYVGGWN